MAPNDPLSTRPVRRAALPVAVALLAILPACTQVTEQQRQQLDRGLKAYDAKQYAAAESDLSAFLGEVRDAPERAEALYVRGLARVQTRRYADARSDLEAALAAKPARPLAGKVLAALGNLDLMQDRPKDAVARYAEALKSLPPEPPLDQVLYRMGLAQQQIGEWEQAKLALSRLLDEFKTSALCDPARQRLRFRYFTVQIAAFRDMDSANRRAAELAKQGLADVKAVADIRNGEPLAIVQVGQFDTLAEARAALPAVQRMVPDAMIVP